MDFQSKKEDFLRNFYQYHCIFEIEKCCGYTEWISTYKKDTLTDLYRYLNIQFATYNKPIYKLFIINHSGEKIFLENDDTSVTDFIKEHTLKPIYPMPHWIVYKLFLDEGIVHKHN